VHLDDLRLAPFEKRIGQPTFNSHADLFHHPARSRITDEVPRLDPGQPKVLEPESQDRYSALSAKTPVPGRLSDLIPHLGHGPLGVDFQTDRTQQVAVLSSGNGEND